MKSKMAYLGFVVVILVNLSWSAPARYMHIVGTGNVSGELEECG